MSEAGRTTDRRSIVYLSGGFGLGVQTMQLFLVPLRANELGATPAQLGMILAGGAIAQAILSVPAGWLIDRIGARKGFLLGTSGAALAAVSCAATENLLVLALLLPVFTIMRMLGWVSSHTYVTGFGRREDVLKHAGRFAVVNSIFSMAAPLLAGLMSDAYSIRLSFLLVGAMAASFTVLGIFLPQQPATRSTFDVRDQIGWRAGLVEVLRTRMIAGGMLLSVTDLWLYAVWTGFFPVALVNAGVTASAAGSVVAVKNGVGIFGALLGHRGERWGLRRETLGAGLLVLAIVGVGISPWMLAVPAAFIPAILFGVGSGAATPISISIVGLARNRGFALGIRSTGNQVSATIAPLLTGAVISGVGLAAAFVLGAGLAGGLLSSAWFGLLRVRPRRDSRWAGGTRRR